MRKKIKIEVAGKLNLSLNVTGRDAYHRLDSVFSSVSQYDTVTVASRADDKIHIDFPGMTFDPYTSTAMKAVEALRRRFGDFGADIVVDKGIPAGSGLGGSSADAAGVIKALDCLFDFSSRGLDAFAAACETGSDTAFMITGGSARARGRGERLEFFEGRMPYEMVLLYPAGGVVTADCFRKFDELYPDCMFAPADTEALIEALRKGDRSCARYCKNALTRPAVLLEPAVGEALDALTRAGAAAAFMTGSGCGCVGLFDALPDLKQFEGFSPRRVELVKEGIIIK